MAQHPFQFPSELLSDRTGAALLEALRKQQDLPTTSVPRWVFSITSGGARLLVLVSRRRVDPLPALARGVVQIVAMRPGEVGHGSRRWARGTALESLLSSVMSVLMRSWSQISAGSRISVQRLWTNSECLALRGPIPVRRSIHRTLWLLLTVGGRTDAKIDRLRCLRASPLESSPSQSLHRGVCIGHPA